MITMARTGQIVRAPALTQAQKDAAWAKIIEAWANQPQHREALLALALPGEEKQEGV